MLKQHSFRMDIKKNYFFPLGTAQSGAGCPEVVQSASLEIFSARLEKSLSYMVWPPQWCCFEQIVAQGAKDWCHFQSETSYKSTLTPLFQHCFLSYPDCPIPFLSPSVLSQSIFVDECHSFSQHPSITFVQLQTLLLHILQSLSQIWRQWPLSAYNSPAQSFCGWLILALKKRMLRSWWTQSWA